MTNMIVYLEYHKDKKNFIKWERREWIDDNYQRKLIEDIKSCVDHDGDWRRINKRSNTSPFRWLLTKGEKNWH
jgi:hypothetical protein